MYNENECHCDESVNTLIHYIKYASDNNIGIYNILFAIYSICKLYVETQLILF